MKNLLNFFLTAILILNSCSEPKKSSDDTNTTQSIPVVTSNNNTDNDFKKNKFETLNNTSWISDDQRFSFLPNQLLVVTRTKNPKYTTSGEFFEVYRYLSTEDTIWAIKTLPFEGVQMYKIWQRDSYILDVTIKEYWIDMTSEFYSNMPSHDENLRTYLKEANSSKGRRYVIEKDHNYDEASPFYEIDKKMISNKSINDSSPLLYRTWSSNQNEKIIVNVIDKNHIAIIINNDFTIISDMKPSTDSPNLYLLYLNSSGLETIKKHVNTPSLEKPIGSIAFSKNQKIHLTWNGITDENCNCEVKSLTPAWLSTAKDIILVESILVNYDFDE